MSKLTGTEMSRRRFIGTTAGIVAASALSQASFAQTQPTDRPLGWALVGLGNLAINELMPALTKTKSANLTALVSGHPDKATALAKKYSLDPKHIYNYDNFDSIKDDPDVDVIYIVLPNGMHAEYTVRARQGRQACLLRKADGQHRRGMSADDRRMSRAKKMLGIGYRMQYEPHLIEAKRLVKEGSIGKIKAVKSEFGFNLRDPSAWRLNKKLAGGGPLMDVGIYCLNSTRFARAKSQSR